jgi:alginate O-acetyltransferase complex protein AlgJ
MDAVSAALARHIDVAVPQGEHGPFDLVAGRAERVGDLVDMLKLPPDQGLFRPQPVTVQTVIDRRTGRAWQRDPASDVLLVGDSFTNIYSQPALGWGESAGLAEHLSYHLGRSVNVLALNGAGASAIRAELARRAASSTEVWPTRVIVYELAMRFLMGENWPLIEIKFPRGEVASNRPAVIGRESPPPTPGTRRAAGTPAGSLAIPGRAAPETTATVTVAPPVEPITVIAEVVQTSKVPAPGTAPYKDCLVYVKMRIDQVESGSAAQREVIAAFWAMRDDQWLPAATYAVGDHLRLTLVPMDQADRRTQALQRADDLNDFALRVYFVTSEVKQ